MCMHVWCNTNIRTYMQHTVVCMSYWYISCFLLVYESMEDRECLGRDTSGSHSSCRAPNHGQKRYCKIPCKKKTFNSFATICYRIMLTFQFQQTHFNRLQRACATALFSFFIKYFLSVCTLLVFLTSSCRIWHAIIMICVNTSNSINKIYCIHGVSIGKKQFQCTVKQFRLTMKFARVNQLGVNVM